MLKCAFIEHTKMAEDFDEHQQEHFQNETVSTGTLSIDQDLSQSDEDNQALENEEGTRYLGILPLSMIVFYNVAGGPFGIEESVRSAGFLVSILGFIIMPFVWSIPESLMTAELGSAFPEASGGVAWVEEAFGGAAGWMAGFLGWVSGATDSKSLHTLFGMGFSSVL